MVAHSFMDRVQPPTSSTNQQQDVGAIVAAFRKAAEKGEPVDPGLFDLKCLSFIGQDLSNLDFSNCDFTCADLSRCNLRNTTCAHAVFDRAILFQAKLDGAEFLSASFQGANLSQCTAQRAGFGQSNLTNANFTMSDLSGATFVNARANHADFRTCKFADARFLEADLTSADFSQSELHRVDFEQANLSGAIFLKATLRGSRLRGVKNYRTAYWIDADIREIDFSGAYLVRRHIMDENFLHEFQNQSATHRFIFWVWWLTSDCGRSAFRWAGFCSVIIVTYGVIFKMLGDQVSYPEGLKDSFAPWYVSIMLACCMAVSDVLPQTMLASVVLNSEVIIGYVGFGGLLTIVATHLGSRGE